MALMSSEWSCAATKGRRASERRTGRETIVKVGKKEKPKVQLLGH